MSGLDDSPCTASTVCLSWMWFHDTNAYHTASTDSYVEAYLYNADGLLAEGALTSTWNDSSTELISSSFNTTSDASGSLTVSDVYWEDEPACGPTTLGMTWAFDENSSVPVSYELKCR